MIDDDEGGPHMSPAAFRRLGTALVERLGGFMDGIADRPVAPAAVEARVLKRLRLNSLPEDGIPAGLVVDEILPAMLASSVLTGHPRFMGFVCSSAAPIGALADLVAASVNANAASALMAPFGSELERQTVRWVAELLGYPSDCGGILVSGGNMANFTALLVARRARAGWDVRARGLGGPAARRLRVYAARTAHTWLQKAVDASGLGLDAIHWVATDDDQRMIVPALQQAVEADLGRGEQPLMVVGSAGTVACGAVDPLRDIAEVARRRGLWFHVDGAYGAPAVAVPGTDPQLAGLQRADSIAVDPHKWLYVPVEAGCVLVRDAAALRDAFSFSPDYYDLGTADDAVNYFEHGLQNTRALRAAKVWMCMRHMGRRGIVKAIAHDLACAGRLRDLAVAHPELEAMSHGLSITTLRYVPEGGGADADLDRLNRDILLALRRGHGFFLSNAIVRDRYALRACVVNFRTRPDDMDELAARIVETGRGLTGDARRPQAPARTAAPTRTAAPARTAG